MAVFCFVWFQPKDQNDEAGQIESRATLLYTLLICVPGLFIARILGFILPFRQRPLYDPNLHLRHAFTFDSNSLISWSSFPSDHAVLFFALATGIYFVNRKVGLFLYVYTLFCIALPRIFLGMHYPSDILAGALLGMAFAFSAKWQAARLAVTRPALRFQERHPGLFYSCFFFLVYQTADLYAPLRGGFQAGSEILRAWLIASR